MRISRRGFVTGVTGIGLSSAISPHGVRAAEGPIRIGLLTVKTGPLASGGIDMERALNMFLKERDYIMSGRKVELVTADTAGVPATARTKTQEMVEKNNVHCLIGPLAAFEALAIDDYIRQAQIPTLSVAAAEDMTQRSANPWFVRATSTSSQCAHPLGEFSAKELKYKKMITIADDIAYGQEMCAGFQRVFEDNGGQIVQKLFPPLTVPDYGSYVGQLKSADAIFLGFAGSNGFRFLRQFVEYGQKDKMQVIGGMTALDEAVLEAAVKAVNGNVEDKPALMVALRSANVDTVRGPVKFDDLGNVVGNVYLRKVTRKDGRLVNSVFKTYPDVSQFWTYGK